MKTLDILSYNIQFGKKFDKIADWITRENLSPDIFCFQEFPEEKVTFFKQFLQKKGYECVFAPAMILYGIQVGQLTAHKQQRLHLIQSEALDLGNHSWERKHKNTKGERCALVTSYNDNGTIISIANVHLTVLSPHSMRYKQLKLIIDALKGDSSPAVIVGDFNYTSLFGVKKLLTFMGNAGYECVNAKLITHKIFGFIPQQLDYVFLKGFVPREIEVLKVPHSDHLPIVTKLALISHTIKSP